MGVSLISNGYHAFNGSCLSLDSSHGKIAQSSTVNVPIVRNSRVFFFTMFILFRRIGRCSGVPLLNTGSLKKKKIECENV